MVTTVKRWKPHTPRSLDEAHTYAQAQRFFDQWLHELDARVTALEDSKTDDVAQLRLF